MLAALATLPFLAALWLSAVVLLEIFGENGGKIAAALKGRSLLAEPVVSTRPVVVRMAPRTRAPVRGAMRVEAELRAAA